MFLNEFQNSNECIYNGRQKYAPILFCLLMSPKRCCFRILSAQWIDVFDEESGFWTFGRNSPSKNIVDSDPFSPNLQKEIKRRQLWVYNDETPSVYPAMEDDCQCGVCGVQFK